MAGWSKEEPTREGYFWWRAPGSGFRRIVQLLRHEDGELWMAFMGRDAAERLGETKGEFWSEAIEPPLNTEAERVKTAYESEDARLFLKAFDRIGGL